MSTEQLKEEALKKVLNAAAATGDFVMEQAPEIITQLLLYNTIVYCVGFVLGVCGLFLSVIALRLAMRARQYSDTRLMWGVISLVSVFVCVPLLGVNTFLLLKITLAPKLWLLEYAANLVR